jgi:ATP phosphoribosyltransferase
LLEFFEAHLTATDKLALSPISAALRLRQSPSRSSASPPIAGLQGPTISRVIVREQDPNWYAVNIIVRRGQIFQAINELRAIGGSGVVVMPVTYIFDETPPRYAAMLKALAE